MRFFKKFFFVVVDEVFMPHKYLKTAAFTGLLVGSVFGFVISILLFSKLDPMFGYFPELATGIVITIIVALIVMAVFKLFERIMNYVRKTTIR